MAQKNNQIASARQVGNLQRAVAIANLTAGYVYFSPECTLHDALYFYGCATLIIEATVFVLLVAIELAVAARASR